VKKKKREEQPLHPRYDRSQPLLRELVSVHIDGNDGESFDVRLTRVPGIGEEIVRQQNTYKVKRVRHYSVDDDGRAFLGYHAFVKGEFIPEEEPPRKRKPWWFA
jgi:hypothetical protein